MYYRRVRRVKCGEEKPHCLKCTSTGRECVYSTASRSKFTEQPQLDTCITLFSGHGPRERRAFEYYFHKADPLLSGVLDQDFWSGSVLQICRVEPVIWDAIISLSVLYERPPIHETILWLLINDPAEVRHEYHRDALVWYSRSLALLRQRIDRGTVEPMVALISCILFIAIELLQGNRKAAQVLYKNGAQMMTDATSTTVVSAMFRRLGTSVLVANESLEETQVLHLALPEGYFTSIQEVRDVLYSIVAETKTLNIDSKAYIRRTAYGQLHKVSELLARQQRLKTRLAQWNRLFSHFKSMHGSNVNIDGAISTLLMIYTSVFIEAGAMLSFDQGIYDTYEYEFAQIIDLAPSAVAWTRNSEGKQPPFMFEMGVFLPLFVTGLKCPFPELRRQALRYMVDAPPAQGPFMCTPAAHIVALVIELEENPDTFRPGKVSQLYDLLARPGHIPPAQHRTYDFSVSSVLAAEGKTKRWLNYTNCYFDEERRAIFIEKRISIS
jgi:hypothetical protein